MAFKKEDIINEIVQMRLTDMASVKTCLEYLNKTYGYKQTYSYEIIGEAQKEIKAYYANMNMSALEESIGQLENLAQEAKSAKLYKLAFEIRKELNNIEGLTKIKIEPIEVKNTITIKFDEE